MKYIGVIFSVLCLSIQINAAEIKEVKTLVRNSLESFYLSEPASQENPTNEESLANWQLQNFYLLFKGGIGFEVPFFASLTVEPHIEFIFGK